MLLALWLAYEELVRAELETIIVQGRIIPHMRVNSFPSAQYVLARQSSVDRRPMAD